MQFIENGIWGKFLFTPLYNVLIWFSNLFPGSNIVLAVVLLTLLVKIILAPLTYKSILSQIQQKKMQPLLNEIKQKYAGDKEKQSKAMIELYKTHKTNPFSGCILIIIQGLVLITLYHIFQDLRIIPEKIYSFIATPESLNYVFLGIKMESKSIILALLAGVTLFIQMHLSPAMKEDKKNTTEPSTKDIKDMSLLSNPDMMKNMQKSMKYGLPVMITFVSYSFPVVGIYFIISNIFTTFQEIVIRKKIERDEQKPQIVSSN